MNSHVACKLIGSIALLGFVMAGPAQADDCPVIKALSSDKAFL